MSPRNHKKRSILDKSASFLNFLSNLVFDKIGFGAHLAHNLEINSGYRSRSGSSNRFFHALRRITSAMLSAARSSACLITWLYMSVVVDTFA